MAGSCSWGSCQLTQLPLGAAFILPKAEVCVRNHVQPYIPSILEALMVPTSQGFTEVRDVFFKEVTDMNLNVINEGGIDKLGEVRPGPGEGPPGFGSGLSPSGPPWDSGWASPLWGTTCKEGLLGDQGAECMRPKMPAVLPVSGRGSHYPLPAASKSSGLPKSKRTEPRKGERGWGGGRGRRGGQVSGMSDTITEAELNANMPFRVPQNWRQPLSPFSLSGPWG